MNGTQTAVTASLRMDTDLRIPLTAAQKALIAEAVAQEPAGMAAWARAVLLKAAEEQLAGMRDSPAAAASAKRR